MRQLTKTRIDKELKFICTYCNATCEDGCWCYYHSEEYCHLTWKSYQTCNCHTCQPDIYWYISWLKSPERIRLKKLEYILDIDKIQRVGDFMPDELKKIKYS
jgi:hypothetical protein